MALLGGLQRTYWEYEPDGIEEDIIDEACADTGIQMTLDGKTETISYADLEEDTQEMTKALLIGVLEWQIESESEDFEFQMMFSAFADWLEHGDIFAE